MKIDKEIEFHKHGFLKKPVWVKRFDIILNYVLTNYSHGNPKVLEIGIGNNDLGLRIKEKGFDYLGLDIDPCLVKKARKKGLKALCKNVDKGFKGLGKYDIIIMLEVISHLINPDFVLKEVGNHLKPEGILIISEYNSAWWKFRLNYLTAKIFPNKNLFEMNWYEHKGVHLHHFSHDGLKMLIGFCGLKIKDDLCESLWAKRGYVLIKKLNHNFFARENLFVCKRK